MVKKGEEWTERGLLSSCCPCLRTPRELRGTGSFIINTSCNMCVAGISADLDRWSPVCYKLCSREYLHSGCTSDVDEIRATNLSVKRQSFSHLAYRRTPNPNPSTRIRSCFYVCGYLNEHSASTPTDTSVSSPGRLRRRLRLRLHPRISSRWYLIVVQPSASMNVGRMIAVL